MRVRLLAVVPLLLLVSACGIPTRISQALPRLPVDVSPVAMRSRPPAATYPLSVSANRHYLVDGLGQPVFWSGDAAWSLIVQLTREDAQLYLANRQQKGVNAILVNLLEHKFAANAPRNANGDPPFAGAPFATPNEVYFEHVDDVINDAARVGMVVLLDPFYVGHNCGDEGWCAEMQAASSDDVRSWGTYIGTRYKSFDNIVWVIGGDTDPSPVSSKVTAFVEALTSVDKRHLMTAHNGVGQMAVTPWRGSSWLTLNSTYARFDGGQTYQLAQSAYAITPPLPFFEIEGYYENGYTMTTQQIRTQAYWTVLSGGMGYIYGQCPVWAFGGPGGYTGCTNGTNNANWKSYLDSPGSAGMILLTEFFTSHAWQDLAPDLDHTFVTEGYGTYGSLEYAPAELTPDGHLGVAYLPSRRTVSVDLSRLSGRIVAQWYDPSNGHYLRIDGSPLEAEGTRRFTPPGSNGHGDGDWVLALESTP